MAFALTSPDFENGGRIPDRRAREGGNLSPQLDWKDPPDGTQSFMLVMEDPDARFPAFRHWAVFNIPAKRRHITRGGSSGARTEILPHAYNDFGNDHYDGPQPPEGARHTYRFRLVALGIPELGIGDRYAGEVWDRARAHILAEAELDGTYA
jgi:Raf kinase inhibitor-like YbhB/YbcL family protein